MGEYQEVCTPEREQLIRYADAFYGLAGLFQKMPCQKEYLGDEELGQLFDRIRRQVCTDCDSSEMCWNHYYFRSCRILYEMMQDAETNGCVSGVLMDRLEEQCSRPEQVAWALLYHYDQARTALLWNNRMMEQRMAAGEQILQTAVLLKRMADSFLPAPDREQKIEKRLRKQLKICGIRMDELHVYLCEENRTEIYLKLSAQERMCISSRSIAEILSSCCGEKMRPAWNCSAAVGELPSVFHFVPETRFQMLCGIAKITKTGELISGDNYAFLQKDTGKVIMSLADGMGSGMDACRESEKVIELLEQFLEAGFPQETAVRMINSCMLLQNSSQIYSTIDLCMIDLYNAGCDMIKYGAASTFIKRGNEVEVIRSAGVPVGMIQQADYESRHRQLSDGCTVVMMTDGVLEYLPEDEREQKLAELICRVESRNAREYAQRLMEHVYLMQQFQAKDDMTILVGNIWKK